MRKSLVCLVSLVMLLMLGTSNAKAQIETRTVEYDLVQYGQQGQSAYFFALPVFDMPEEAVFLGWTVNIATVAESYLTVTVAPPIPPNPPVLPSPFIPKDGGYVADLFLEFSLNGTKKQSEVYGAEFGELMFVDSNGSGNFNSRDDFWYAGPADQSEYLFLFSGTEINFDSFVLTKTDANYFDIDPSVTADGWNSGVQTNLLPGGKFIVTYQYDMSNVVTPEPATMLILLGGLAACPLMRRFRKK